MLLKIQLICCLALLAKAQNSIEQLPGEIQFETSHKRPDENDFQTSHKIPRHSFLPETDLDLLQGTMNLLPTKERPELNPVLSALINEDVMKSIEAKRAIEKEELEQIKAEIDAARKQKEEEERRVAETRNAVLTTAAPISKAELDDSNIGLVDQEINFEAAGTDNKKSRIEIKKGPNGQDYEYEYVYYYEDEEDAKPSEAPAKADSSERGKSRYSNIERTTAAPASNSLVSNKAKGRSSSLSDSSADDVEAERLPANTRFPSRGKNVDAQPTPAIDSLENAAEKKKISVKRPSLELVDSATFNTDEKQVKGIRNSDTETKSAIAIEQEQAAAAAAAEKKEAEEKKRRQPTIGSDEENVTVKDAADEEVEQTTLSMEKAALDLYAILQNENFNMDMTTDADTEVTTVLPDTTNPDDEGLTTIVDEAPSSTTSTTTTTTTEATTTTTTTTTTTAAPSLFGGKRPGLNSARPNRFKLNKGGKSEASTTTTTEAPAPEAPKTGKNRFSRPSIGGRARPGARTTTAAPAPAAEEEEEVAAPKEVKPVSSGFGRGRPRNRFNLRSTTTTEKPAGADAEETNEEASVSSTTARTLRGGRPQLSLRGRSRTTTAKPAAEEEHKDEETAASAAEEKPAPAPAKPASRFARPGGNRLLPRGKLARTTEAPAADDSAADSSHHNDVKGEENGEEGAEKAAEAEAKPAAHHGLNRLKTRPQLHKTENAKPKAAPAPVAPRKVNPLLAKRRLQLGHSTTEAPAEEDNATAAEESKTEEESAPAAASADAPAAENADSAKDEAADEAETTTKQQARGLGLLTQRRRLPLRKPGTIL
ncbi:mucin-19 [Bactrocera neohumeralis]|uniref:mucin-19 n=1 Tax=Bactrocera neohumeralis TaxID=98809 RepID=UPI002165CC2C|nr:mucin-19 [Bactrocera neohumeralis]XP_050332263.1 mucin-19 [Bactrocera neohumeralis]XP_050332264.1 mucin-19 [Bactrocera neohumeralis]XP_050332265.1 mucin-19 [Bactrocera neohumeralis]XP_050332266.1 mucin-19 [Bactrocera neohumeralis]XP_050332267.1 mucin-19 [Bactrocera neohumeralis]